MPPPPKLILETESVVDLLQFSFVMYLFFVLFQDEEEANDEKEAKSARMSSAGRARKVDKIARIVFPLGFLIFNIVFWTYYSLDVNNHEQER